MKLNEAIKKYEQYYKQYHIRYKAFSKFLKHEHNNYQAIVLHKLADDYFQLVRWLKDYKRLLKQNKHKGHWIAENAKGYHFYGKCSHCGQEFNVDAWCAQNMNYCPNCGCRMREVTE